MDTFRINSDVFVTTGYMDSQCTLNGYQGRIVAKQAHGYLVRDGRGEVALCMANELQPISNSLKHALPASPVLHPPLRGAR